VLLSGMLGIVSLLATGVLIVMVVQQDAIPGLTQDWLVRPIRRRDLLLSKVLFVALLVQGPIFLIEVGQCLAAGFPIGPSLAAPLSRSVWMLLAMDLPVLAFATLTRSLAHAAGAAIAIVVGFAIFTQATILYTNSLFNSIWVTDAAQAAWGVAGVAAVLAIQYYRRRTTGARWVYGAAALVWLFVQFLPWQPVFAIEKRLSPQPAAADGVQIAFDPAFGKFHRPAGQPAPISARASRVTNDVDVWAPLRVSGVSDGQMLTNDGAVVRLIGPGGTMIDLGRSGMPIPWDLRSPFHYLIFIPKDVYNHLKDQSVGLEIDYSLTLLQANSARTIPAAGGDQWIEDAGRCATRTSAGGTLVEVGCLSPGNMPCVTLSLEYNGTVQRPTQGSSGCRSDYAPYFGRINGDSISRFARELPFVGSEDARVVVKAYRPEAHFTRQVVIPNIRLSDWRPE
jgi:hypothetical protein